MVRELIPPLGPRLGETAIVVHGDGIFNFNGQAIFALFAPNIFFAISIS